MKELDINLNYFFNDKRMCKFNVPKSYEPTTVSLLYENDLIEETTYEPTDFNINAWFMHPFLDVYDISKFKVIKNMYGHNGQHETNLFYIHINKCGGSSIETVAYEYGIRWGKWHPSKFKYHEPSEYFMNQPDLIKDKTLFTTIRNPYKRLISGVYCPFTRVKYNVLNEEIGLDKFNELIKYLITTNHTYYDYIYHNNNKVIPHVLKLENLNTDFNKLMFDYNCDIRISKKRNSSDNYYFGKKYGVEDISLENIKLINEKYKKDFIYFDYEMI